MLTYLLNGITVLLVLGALWLLFLGQKIKFRDSEPVREVSTGAPLSEALQAQITSIIDAKITEALIKFDLRTPTRPTGTYDVDSFWRLYTGSLARTNLQPTTLLAFLGGVRTAIQGLETQNFVPQGEAAKTEVEALIARLTTPQSNPPRSPENTLVTSHPWEGAPGTTRH